MKSKKTVKKNQKWYSRLWDWTKNHYSHAWPYMESLSMFLLGGALILNCLSLSTVAGLVMLVVGLKRLKH